MSGAHGVHPPSDGEAGERSVETLRRLRSAVLATMEIVLITCTEAHWYTDSTTPLPRSTQGTNHAPALAFKLKRPWLAWRAKQQPRTSPCLASASGTRTAALLRQSLRKICLFGYQNASDLSSTSRTFVTQLPGENSCLTLLRRDRLPSI